MTDLLVRATHKRELLGLPGGGWLYLVDFGDTLKIGITGHMYSRVESVQLAAKKPLIHAYGMRCGSTEAKRREALIKRSFGEKRKSGQYTEWLPGDCRAWALLFMHEPACAAVFQRMRTVFENFDADGIDKTFLPITRDMILPQFQRQKAA